MPASTSALSIFCDDVRIEVGNKLSLMGIYTADMIFAPGTFFPAILPRLCVATWVMVDIASDVNTFATQITFPDGSQSPLIPYVSTDFPPGLSTEGAIRKIMSQIVPIAPCVIPVEGILEVWVTIQNERIKSGRITVNTFTDSGQALAQSTS